MIEPDTPWTAVFLVFTAVIIAFEALLIPFSIAFEVEPPPWYSVLLVVTFSLDIILSFNTGIHYFGYVIQERKLVAYHYATHMCLVDVISTIPWDLIFDRLINFP